MIFNVNHFHYKRGIYNNFTHTSKQTNMHTHSCWFSRVITKQICTRYTRELEPRRCATTMRHNKWMLLTFKQNSSRVPKSKYLRIRYISCCVMSKITLTFQHIPRFATQKIDLHSTVRSYTHTYSIAHFSIKNRLLQLADFMSYDFPLMPSIYGHDAMDLCVIVACHLTIVQHYNFQFVENTTISQFVYMSCG